MSLKARFVHLSHKDGTKEYRVVTVSPATGGGNSITLFNWGSIGAHGELQVERGGAALMRNAADTKIRAKRKRGYTVETDKAVTFDFEQIDEVLGNYYTRVGVSAINFIRDGLPAKAKPGKFETKIDGSWIDPDDPLGLEEMAKPEPPPKVADMIAKQKNPNWGMF